MEPKKNLKKHHLTEPKWNISWSQQELINRINEISNQIHRNTLRGPANWVLMGSEAHRLFDEAMRDYTVTQDVEIGDWRIVDDTFVQDITVTPNRSVEYLDLNITITGDTWTEI